MDFRQEKIRVFQHMLTKAMAPTSFSEAMAAAGVQVPDMLKARWLKQLDTVKIPKEMNWKLMNRFMMGADPEFILTNNRDGGYLFAESMGLDTLRAFGADMSGRQAELRVAPSRSCVELLAGVLETLRWMNVFLGEPQVEWRAPAFYVRDGCGGHIHFGRRRPYRPAEIKNLDRATGLLLAAGVLDANENRNRIANGYGRNGDFRIQPHGYEYRTTPTWLCSPEVAFITLVISKLTLLHPQPFPVSQTGAVHQLMNLLALYKGLDDDAAIAYAWIKRNGLPRHQVDNFKMRWGIPPSTAGERDTQLRNARQRYFIPEVIPPSQRAKRQIFEYLTMYRPMNVDGAADVTWDLFKLPKDVFNVEVQMHAGGLSEIGSGLVSKGTPVNIRHSGGGRSFQVRTPIALNRTKIEMAIKELLPKWEGKVEVAIDPGYKPLTIAVPPNVYQNHLPVKTLCNAFRKVISDPSLFPICKGTKFNEVKWPEQYVEAALPVKLIGHRIQF